MIDRLVATPLRQLWPHEAVDFTPWLADNIDLLGDALGMTFEEVDTEASVGGFSADLVAVNDQGETVIVENLLDASDHRHLGQLITYAAGLGAAYAVLVAESFRDEHRSALGWLNDVSRDGFGFFGVEVAAWRIADSAPAPQLSVVVEPDNWRRAVRAADTGRKAIYAQFWAGFLPRLHQAEPRWRGTRAPQRENWMQFKSAAPAVKYIARVRPSTLTAQAYIDTGDDTTTSELYDRLHEQRHEIEAVFGAELLWNRLGGRRASVINTNCPDDVNVEDSDTWPALWEWLVPTMGRLANAIDPVLDPLLNDPAAPLQPARQLSCVSGAEANKMPVLEPEAVPSRFARWGLAAGVWGNGSRGVEDFSGQAIPSRLGLWSIRAGLH